MVVDEKGRTKTADQHKNPHGYDCFAPGRNSEGQIIKNFLYFDVANKAFDVDTGKYR